MWFHFPLIGWIKSFILNSSESNILFLTWQSRLVSTSGHKACNISPYSKLKWEWFAMQSGTNQIICLLLIDIVETGKKIRLLLIFLILPLSSFWNLLVQSSLLKMTRFLGMDVNNSEMWVENRTKEMQFFYYNLKFQNKIGSCWLFCLFYYRIWKSFKNLLFMN